MNDEHVDRFYQLHIWKTDVERALNVSLTSDQFDEVMLESNNTFIDEILRDLKLMKKDLCFGFNLPFTKSWFPNSCL